MNTLKETLDQEIALDETIHWKLDAALDFLRIVEPLVKLEAACCLGLAGGVLRNGYSVKDLDIIVIPMNGNKIPDTKLAVQLINTAFDGELYELNISKYKKQTYGPLNFTMLKNKSGKRIDVIVQA